VVLAASVSLFQKSRHPRNAPRSGWVSLLVLVISGTLGIGILELQSYRLQRMMQHACAEEFEFLLRDTPVERIPRP
jgi:hypothetical protein